MNLEDGEKAAMPMSGTLSSVEKELVRQWILFGAPKEGEVVKEAIIKDYYENNKGLAAFPEATPPAPDPSEGFQIKMGPFFLDPAGENEYFMKYQLDNEHEIEVNRVEIMMSNYSHHFIIYDYGSDAKEVPDGLRKDQNHTSDVSFVATVQEPRDIKLPEKTAFRWGKNHVLDLNSHYINYSSDLVYQSEVYVNIYTQPMGTALQEMQATLIPNIFIPIPNNGNEIVHSARFRYTGNIFAWNIGAHTHRYGTGYKIWLMSDTNERDKLIYDASCPSGIPGCVAPYYDYQHIPVRTFDNLLHIDLSKGIFHEATWVNDGPEPVAWGPTSKDEMMLFGLFFVTDTTGLGLSGELTTSVEDLYNPLNEIEVFPNPVQEIATIILPPDVGAVRFRLFDMLGKELQQLNDIHSASIEIQTGELVKGMYLFTVEDEQGRSYIGKILVE